MVFSIDVSSLAVDATDDGGRLKTRRDNHPPARVGGRAMSRKPKSGLAAASIGSVDAYWLIGTDFSYSA